MKKTYSAFLTAVLLFGASTAFAAGALDGKTFTGPMGPKGSETSRGDDTVTFKRGKFNSSICAQFGYSDGKYKTETKDGALEFTARTKNKKGDTMDWKGTVKDGKLDATAVTTEDGATDESWFKGTLKK